MFNSFNILLFISFDKISRGKEFAFSQNKFTFCLKYLITVILNIQIQIVLNPFDKHMSCSYF